MKIHANRWIEHPEDELHSVTCSSWKFSFCDFSCLTETDAMSGGPYSLRSDGVV
jgi:hypothetical protein